MKGHNFLHKLFREGKIRIVDPSLQVQEAYRRKSESYLISAKILLENGRLKKPCRWLTTACTTCCWLSCSGPA